MKSLQTWRRTYADGANMHFNPPPDLIAKSLGKPRVFFVHTGKCGGGSIIRGIRELFGRNGSFYEFHVFDANRCINSALSILSETTNYNPILIATRDPLKRWESSFNWDYHKIFLSRGQKKFFGSAKYTSARRLAHGIMDGCHEAMAIGRKGHMGLGISWYLNRDNIALLRSNQVSVVRTEHIDADFAAFAMTHCHNLGESLDSSLMKKAKNYRLPHTKSDFKANYPENTFEPIDYSDRRLVNALTLYLSNDVITHRNLIDRFAPGHML